MMPWRAERNRRTNRAGMDYPPSHYGWPEMFATVGRYDVCTICGAHLPRGEAASVAGDLHWTFHNGIEDRLRKLEAELQATEGNEETRS